MELQTTRKHQKHDKESRPDVNDDNVCNVLFIYLIFFICDCPSNKSSGESVQYFPLKCAAQFLSKSTPLYLTTDWHPSEGSPDTGMKCHLRNEQQAQSHSHGQMSVSKEQHEHPVGVQPRHQREPAEKHRQDTICSFTRALSKLIFELGVSVNYTQTNVHIKSSLWWFPGRGEQNEMHHNLEALHFNNCQQRLKNQTGKEM